MEASDHSSEKFCSDEQASEVDYFNFRAPAPRLPTGIVPMGEDARPRRVRQVGHVITLTFGFLCAVVLALAFTSASQI